MKRGRSTLISKNWGRRLTNPIPSPVGTMGLIQLNKLGSHIFSPLMANSTSPELPPIHFPFTLIYSSWFSGSNIGRNEQEICRNVFLQLIRVLQIDYFPWCFTTDEDFWKIYRRLQCKRRLHNIHGAYVLLQFLWS